MGLAIEIELEEAVEEKVRLGQLWHVILLDDDDHTYSYVVDMLMAVFGHSREAAYRMTVEVDSTGGRFGPFAGQLFVLDPAAHAIFMVAPDGGISLFADGLVGTQFSDLSFAPDGQSMYVGAGDRLLRISLEPLCP